MKVAKITGRWDYMDVRFEDERVVRIAGELLANGFVAYKGSIREWRVPEGNPISESEKQEIIEAVIEKTKGSHMVVTFE